MRLSRYEQETIIAFNEEEKTAGVYTHNKALIRKLEQLAHDRPDECFLEKVSHDGQAMDYVIPKSWLKITPPRQLSEAQLAARKEALKKAHLARKMNYAHGDSENENAWMGKDIPQTSDGSQALEMAGQKEA